MVVDLGGIRFPLSVEYDDSGTKRFIADIASAQAAFAQFRVDLAAGAGAARSFSTARRNLTDEEREAQKALKEEQTALRNVIATENERLAVAKRLAESIKKEADAIERKRLADQKAAQALPTAAKGVSDELAKADRSSSNIFFTFRRLIGVFAVFRLVREGVSAFTDLVTSGVKFDATMEQSTNSIQGLLLSLTNIKDEQGKVVTGAQAIAAANSEAARQVQLLQRDVVKTTSSLEQLVENFTTAIGPGLQAGLKLDEIRQLAVRVSQIAPLASLAQNQIAQEIRSLTQGNIRTQTDRIATIFGITSADIANAKRTGELFEFLEGRFAGVEIIGRKLQFTLDGLKNKFVSSIQAIAGTAAGGLFDNLKETLAGLNDTIRDSKSFEPNPKIALSFRAIFDAISGVLDVVRQLGSSSGLSFIETTANSIASIITVAGTLLAGLSKGLVDAFNDVVAPIRLVAALLGIDGVSGSLAEIVALITEVLAVAFLVNKAWSLGETLLKNLVTKTVELADGSTLVQVRWLGVLAAIIAVAAIVNQITQRVIGTNFTIGTQLQALGSLVVDGFRIIGDGLIIVAGGIVESVQFLFNKGIQKVLEFTSFVSDNLSQFATFVGAAGIGDALNKFAGDAQVAAAKFGSAAKESFAVTQAAIEDLKKTAEAAFTTHLDKVLEDAAKGDSASSLGEAIGKQLTAGLDAVLALMPKKIQDAINGARKAVASGTGSNSFEAKGKSVEDKQLDALRKMQQETALTAIQARNLQQITVLKQANAAQSEIELANARGALAIAQQEQVALAQNNAILNDRAKAQAESVVGEEQKAFAAQQYTASVAKGNAQLDLASAKVAEATERLREASEVVNGTFFEGLNKGLQDWANNVPTVFQQGVNTMRNILNQFSAELSSAIVDAFDPTNDSSFRERLGGLLKSIAQQLLQNVIQTLLASAIGRATADTAGAAIQVSSATTAAALIEGAYATGTALEVTSATTAAATITGAYAAAAATQISAAQTAAAISAAGSVAALHYGGVVKGFNSGGPVHSHADAQGFARGGGYPTRPAWVHPADTVPAWLTPGEFVQPVSRVRQYGMDLMEALRTGRAPVHAMRAAAGFDALSSARMPPVGTSLAGGGVAPAGNPSTVKASGPTPAFIVANNAALETLLGGGHTAMMRFFRENSDAIDGILRRSRPSSR